MTLKNFITPSWLLLSSACTMSRHLLSLTLTPQEKAGVGKIWERTQTGQLIPTNQSSISYHMVLCTAVKTHGKEKKGEKFMVKTFVLPSNYIMSAEAFLEMGGTCQ